MSMSNLSFTFEFSTFDLDGRTTIYAILVASIRPPKSLNARFPLPKLRNNSTPLSSWKFNTFPISDAHARYPTVITRFHAPFNIN